jgi:hypothetical protein
MQTTGDLGNFGGAGGILDKMESTKLVRCDQATRYFGVSLTNANIVISLALAAVAAWGIRQSARRAEATRTSSALPPPQGRGWDPRLEP